MDEVTFATLVTEGKLSAVTVAVKCGKTGIVTPQTVVLGDRVAHGPALPEGNMPKGITGTVTSLTTNKTVVDVRWDNNNGCYSYYIGQSDEFAGEFTGGPTVVTSGPTVVTAYFIGNGENSTFNLLGDANHRLAKLTPWLESNGFKKNGPDIIQNEGMASTKTVTFTKASVPF